MTKHEREWERFLDRLQPPTREEAERALDAALASGRVTREELDRSRAKLWTELAECVGSCIRRWLGMRQVSAEALAQDWQCETESVETLLGCVERVDPADQGSTYDLVVKLASETRVPVTGLMRAVTEGGLSREIHVPAPETLAARNAPNAK